MKKPFRDIIGDLRIYFLRGHSSWLGFVMTLVNFALIFYNFFWIKINWLPDWLKVEYMFITLFLLVYFPLATLLGYWDMKRGTFQSGQRTWRANDPIWKEVHEKLDTLLREISPKK